MATHAQNIQNLRDAIYGEQVRGSMIELFEEDYALVKDGVMLGTDISSTSDPITGYVDGAVYINDSTWHIFKLEGTAWADHGTIKGDTGASVVQAVDNGDGTFYLEFSDGSVSANIATIQGLQGPQGPQGPTGPTGPAGRDVTSITMSGTGKSHPITATYSDGSTQTIGVVQDGADGTGAGDMTKATYDPNDHGFVDKAAGVTDGTNVLTYNTLNNKANAATSLAGYGITDAYTKTEADDAFLEAPAAGVTAGEVMRADGSSGVNWETVDSAPASASTKLVTSGGVYTALTVKANKSVLDAHLSRTPRDISSEIGTNGATLLAAIAEQNLEKYGFKIGDYFMSPANRSLVTQTYSSGSVTTQTVNVKFKYYLADMDAWYGGYDSYEVVGTHHVELFVDCMINRQWHSASDITNVGYDLSALYTYLKGSILDAIKADMKALFGGSTGLEHLLSHQLYLTKSFTACEWVSTYIHTPSEFEVYGGNAFSGNDAQKYAFNKKLALFDKFRFNQILGSGNALWLYNMYSASYACFAYTSGAAYSYSPVYTGRAAGLILLH